MKWFTSDDIPLLIPGDVVYTSGGYQEIITTYYYGDNGELVVDRIESKQ